ncbi:hypothetical protein tb265_06870 [Gemmatimonadetes bacterium T265]|nr:hypothetical protein tb265_06870 [Gemmatimonadetes bacterium T265]
MAFPVRPHGGERHHLHGRYEFGVGREHGTLPPPPLQKAVADRPFILEVDPRLARQGCLIGSAPIPPSPTPEAAGPLVAGAGVSCGSSAISDAFVWLTPSSRNPCPTKLARPRCRTNSRVSR